MIWGAVVVAAGSGTRFGRPKQLVEIAGLPMVGWSIRAFAGMPEIAEIVVVTEPELMDAMRLLALRLAPDGRVQLVRGGARRQESVYEGVRVLAASCEGVLVHDGARPLIGASDVRAAMREVRARRGALLGAPVIDTIKQVDGPSMCVSATLDRSALWSAQTPQLALRAELLAAHERARRDGVEATDDAALLERDGIEVAMVPSSGENFKVTQPGDVARAEALVRSRNEPSAG